MERKETVVNKNIKLSKLWQLIFFITLISCLASCYNNIYFGKGFFEAGPTNKIKTENWEKLKIGMTKKEVIDLLGDSPSKHIISVHSPEKSSNAFEFWEYEYRSSPISIPHPKAYVVYFNQKGLVSKLREPMNTE